MMAHERPVLDLSAQIRKCNRGAFDRESVATLNRVADELMRLHYQMYSAIVARSRAAKPPARKGRRAGKSTSRVSA